MVLAFSFLLRFPDGTSQNVPFAFEVGDAMLILAGLCGGDYVLRVLPHIQMVERGKFFSVSIQFDQQRLVEAVICRATESINGSALAIRTALTLWAVFRLALRQTEGLIGSILRRLGSGSGGTGSLHPQPSRRDPRSTKTNHTPSGPPARGPLVNMGVFASSWLHPVRSWSLRDSRDGSTAPAPLSPNVINNHFAKRAPSRHDIIGRSSGHILHSQARNIVLDGAWSLHSQACSRARQANEQATGCRHTIVYAGWSNPSRRRR
jgi:hypothetical protein